MENEIICRGCGCVIESEENALMIGDDPYCADCAVECYECGEIILRDDAIVSSDGEYFCDLDCARNADYDMCEDCGEVVPSHCIVVVNEGTRYEGCVCEECADGGEYFRCDNCHSYFDTLHFSPVTTHYGEEICESCCDSSYGTCEECMEIFSTYDLAWTDDDRLLCDSCREQETRRNGCINRYSYKPSAIYFGLNGRRPVFGDPLTFGFELEVDKGDDQGYCAGEIEDTMGDQVYMKEDGSVTFEIVSHPMTLDYLRSEFDMKTLCSIPPKYGFKSHDAGTCGLHVHVGRKQLGLDTDEQDRVIERICVLMLRHWDNLVRFTRREQSQLRRWASKPDLFSGRGEKHICINELHERFEAYECDGDRYVALNLCNRDTIEFRVYRGSLKPETVLASLEFTSNICRYAMEHDLRDVLRSSWEDVALFERYPELCAYLEERGLTGESKHEPNILPVRAVYEADAGDYVRVKMSGVTFCAELLNNIHADSPIELVNIRIPESMKALGFRPGEVTIPVNSIIEIALPDEVARESEVFNLHVGSRVTISRDSYYRELTGLSATVIALRDEYQRGYESIGLSIDGYHDGHSLDGACENLGYPIDSGWWVRLHDIGQVIA